MRANGELLPFLNLQLHCLLSFRCCCTDGGRFLSNSGVSTSSSFLYLLLLFINWYAFGFSFRTSSQSPWEGVVGDLECQCSFVRLYLFLSAFLIICIETFGFFVDCLKSWSIWISVWDRFIKLTWNFGVQKIEDQVLYYGCKDSGLLCLKLNTLWWWLLLFSWSMMVSA